MYEEKNKLKLFISRVCPCVCEDLHNPMVISHLTKGGKEAEVMGVILCDWLIASASLRRRLLNNTGRWNVAHSSMKWDHEESMRG